MPDAGLASGEMDAGYWMLDARYWMLDTGYLRNP